jgi:hypothetical protein
MAHGKRRRAVRWIGGHAFTLNKSHEPVSTAVCSVSLETAEADRGQVDERCQACKRGLEMTW